MKQFERRILKLECSAQPGVARQLEDWLRRFSETDEFPPLEYSPAAVAFLDEILHGQQ